MANLPAQDLVVQLATLTTEAYDPEFRDIDLSATESIVVAMNQENAAVVAAVVAASAPIAAAIDAIAERMRRGGRLIYAGAGTAGRMGVLDASECPPTFSTPPGLVVGLMAGGVTAVTRAVEGAEDDFDGSLVQFDDLQLSEADSVVGISASGRTRYAVGALTHARARGALAVALAGNRESELGTVADHVIEVEVGAEFLVGSTRLKAATVQKLVLNTISTVVMMRLGRTYGNLMVNMTATNDKLRARARRIVVLATGCEQGRADTALADAGGDVKAAILMVLADVDSTTAQERLERAGGHLRAALEG
jgi:N-acetylmuramic acid 6-phosphate etherase